LNNFCGMNDDSGLSRGLNTSLYIYWLPILYQIRVKIIMNHDCNTRIGSRVINDANILFFSVRFYLNKDFYLIIDWILTELKQINIKWNWLIVSILHQRYLVKKRSTYHELHPWTQYFFIFFRKIVVFIARPQKEIKLHYMLIWRENKFMVWVNIKCFFSQYQTEHKIYVQTHHHHNIFVVFHCSTLHLP
jgi:hypothetical protein